MSAIEPSPETLPKGVPLLPAVAVAARDGEAMMAAERAAALSALHANYDDLVPRRPSHTERDDSESFDVDEVLTLAAVSYLARERRKRGLTQRQLGDLVGLDQSRISRIEKHPTRASVGILLKIAKALNTDLGNLVRLA